MIYYLYPYADATIYEDRPIQNTGLDSILEIGKILLTSGSNPTTSSIYVSRVVMGFNFSKLNDLVGAIQYTNIGDLGTGSLRYLSSSQLYDTAQVTKYYLQLRTTEAIQLPLTYSLFVNVLSGSWNMGLGKYNYSPQNTEGISWKYTNGLNQAISWQTGSFTNNATASYYRTLGGGNWYTGSNATQSVCAQTFSYQDSLDTNIDVSNIADHCVRYRISDSIIVKFPEAAERSILDTGKLQFYSVDTHTIYPPRLKVGINDYYYNRQGALTASLLEVTDSDNVLYINNFKDSYNLKDRIKFRIQSRPRFPAKTFATSSNLEFPKYFLGSGSLYGIKDFQTNDMIVDFDPNFTTINLDTTGSYFNFWMESLEPERYYELQILSQVNDSETSKRKITGGFIFKVSR